MRSAARVFAIALVAALIPALTAALLFGRLAGGRDTDAADARLAGGLQTAAARFDAELDAASRTAVELAETPAVVEALATRDPAALAGAVAGRDQVALVAPDGTVLAGRRADPAAVRSAPVLAAPGVVGRVEVAVPVDRALAARLAGESTAILTVGAQLAAGPPGAAAALALAEGSRELELDGRTYRYAAATLADGPPPVTLALVEPVDGAGRGALLLAAVVTAITVAALAALVVALRAGRAPAVRVERRTRSEPHDAVREALALVGEALAATHNPRALAPVILETTMEATGAVGGRLLEDGEQLAVAGQVEGRTRALRLPLAAEHGSSTTLVLYPPRGGFSKQARELAQWLADQAAIALESARLHRLVEQQAITDELTGLANRRRFMEILEMELSRAERFDGSVAVVLSDLDDFKSVNDRFGHQVGDAVLGAFADVLTERVRGIDLAARLGGEEFAVLLPQTDLEGGTALAERLRTALSERGLDVPEGERLHVTASFGVAFYPGCATVSELLNAADQALYQAKRQGKNRVVAAAA